MPSGLHNSAAHRLTINPIRITVWLAGIGAVLAMVSFALQIVKYKTGHENLLGFVELMNVDGEQNVPTFFSVLLLATSSVLLGFIGFLVRRARAPDLSRWVVLCAGFAFMAVDEGWTVHEHLIAPMRKIVGVSHQYLGVFHFAWVLPALGLLVALGIYFIGFLSRLPLPYRIRFIVAGAVYLSGAVGMEMLGGAYADVHGEDNLTYKLFTTVEESLEMTGLIAFIDALLRYLCFRFEQVTTRFREDPADNTVANLVDNASTQFNPANTGARRHDKAAVATMHRPSSASPAQSKGSEPIDPQPASDRTLIRPPHRR